MKKMIGMLLASAVVSSANAANIVCKGESSQSGLPVQVEIARDEVIVTGGFLHKPRVFANLTHVEGLTTASGLAVTMENHYGCIRKAVVITSLRETTGNGVEVLHFGTCAGGETSDEICGAN